MPPAVSNRSDGEEEDKEEEDLELKQPIADAGLGALRSEQRGVLVQPGGQRQRIELHVPGLQGVLVDLAAEQPELGDGD